MRMGISISHAATGVLSDDHTEYSCVEDIPQIVFSAMNRPPAEFGSKCITCGRMFQTAQCESGYECPSCALEETERGE